MNDYKAMNRAEKTEYWQKKFDECKQNGLTHKKFCELNGLSYWNYRDWFKKLSKISSNENQKFVKLNLQTQTKQSLINAESHIEIKFREISITASESISSENLRKIFSALNPEALHV